MELLKRQLTGNVDRLQLERLWRAITGTGQNGNLLTKLMRKVLEKRLCSILEQKQTIVTPSY